MATENHAARPRLASDTRSENSLRIRRGPDYVAQDYDSTVVGAKPIKAHRAGLSLQELEGCPARPPVLYGGYEVGEGEAEGEGKQEASDSTPPLCTGMRS